MSCWAGEISGLAGRSGTLLTHNWIWPSELVGVPSPPSPPRCIFSPFSGLLSCSPGPASPHGRGSKGGLVLKQRRGHLHFLSCCCHDRRPLFPSLQLSHNFLYSAMPSPMGPQKELGVLALRTGYSFSHSFAHSFTHALPSVHSIPFLSHSITYSPIL